MSARRYPIRITRRVEKDIKRLTPQLRSKLRDILLEVIAVNPHQGKKLMGDLAGSYSHRLTYKDRIVYSMDTKRRMVYVERAATRYGE
jgi:mRNA-degrading endonuclease RelE of RelBE toxin-antitoxin system